MGCISRAICNPVKGGEVDRLCCYRPVTAGKLCRAGPYVVGAANNLNGCGGYVGACVGLCIICEGELKCCGIGCGCGVGLAILVDRILRNYPLDIAIGICLGVDGPLDGSGVACSECIVRIKELKGYGSGVGACIGSGVAGDADDACEALVLCLDSSVYALLGSIVLKRIGVVPLYDIGSGDGLRINLNAYLVSGFGLDGAKAFKGDNNVILAGVCNVSNLKGCCVCAVNNDVVLVPNVCIVCGCNVGSYGSSKDNGAVAVYDALCGCGKLCGCICGNCVKLNVCRRHLGVSITLCIYPSYDGHSAVLGGAGEEVYVSAYGKEALTNELGALVVAYLVNVVEGNLNLCGNGDNLIIKECIKKVANGLAYLVCCGIEVNGLCAACLKLTVRLVEVKESLFLYGLGKIAISLCDVLKSYCVVLLVLLDLSLDLLLGKTVENLELAYKLVIEDLIEINVLEDLHKVIEGNVVDECVHIIYVSGEAAKYLLLNAIGNAGGLASLESCLSKLVRNIYLDNELAVFSGDRKISCNDRCNLSYSLVSAAKLNGYVKLALAEVGVEVECIRKLHFIVFHLGNFSKRRKLLCKCNESIEEERLTVCGIAEESKTVNLNLIKKIEKENAIVKAVVINLDLFICLGVFIEENGIHLFKSCFKLSKSDAELFNECSADKLIACSGEFGDYLAEELACGACIVLGIRELLVRCNLGDYCRSEYSADEVSKLLYRSVTVDHIGIKGVLSILSYCAVLLSDVNLEHVIHNELNELNRIRRRIVSDDLILYIVEHDISADLNDKLNQFSVGDLLDRIERSDLCGVDGNDYVVVRILDLKPIEIVFPRICCRIRAFRTGRAGGCGCAFASRLRGKNRGCRCGEKHNENKQECQQLSCCFSHCCTKPFYYYAIVKYFN